MKFKTYPSYKDSGVEWLGDVPEGWAIKKLSTKLYNPYQIISSLDAATRNRGRVNEVFMTMP